MDKSEYLILSYVVRLMEPVGALSMQGDDFRIWFNAEEDGLGFEELADVLQRLFQRGDILARWRTPERSLLEPSKADIERALNAEGINDPVLFDYGLTTAGGQRWESVTNPDWKRYFQNVSGPGKNGTMQGEVVAADYARAKEYFDSLGLNTLTFERDIVSPWQATY